MGEWKEISLHDIKNIRIGHAQDEEHATGCSVIICEKKAICGVEEAYRTGRGKIRVRAVTNIEPMANGKSRIVYGKISI